MRELTENILDDLRHILTSMEPTETKELLDAISRARRIFIVGRGRTGMISGTFAMRLMHLGYETYVVGEITTPRITSDDLLVACSGSGEVRMVQQMVRIAKEAKAETFLLTYNPKSTIARCVNRIVTIPAGLEAPRTRSTSEVLFPLGSRYEEALFLYLDVLVLLLMRRQSITEGQMAKRHTNLE